MGPFGRIGVLIFTKRIWRQTQGEVHVKVKPRKECPDDGCLQKLGRPGPLILDSQPMSCEITHLCCVSRLFCGVYPGSLGKLPHSRPLASGPGLAQGGTQHTYSPD